MENVLHSDVRGVIRSFLSPHERVRLKQMSWFFYREDASYPPKLPTVVMDLATKSIEAGSDIRVYMDQWIELVLLKKQPWVTWFDQLSVSCRYSSEALYPWDRAWTISFEKRPGEEEEHVNHRYNLVYNCESAAAYSRWWFYGRCTLRMPQIRNVVAHQETLANFLPLVRREFGDIQGTGDSDFFNNL